MSVIKKIEQRKLEISKIVTNKDTLFDNIKMYYNFRKYKNMILFKPCLLGAGKINFKYSYLK